MRNLLPEQLADLAKSGINEKMIQEAQLRSELPKQLSNTLDTRLPSGVESGLVFRYFTPEGKPLTETVRNATHPYQRDVVRAKLFYKPGAEGRKYMGQRGSTNHLYLPPLTGFKEKLLDASVPLYFIEGEKKLLRFWQADFGFAAAGISGVWNFRATGAVYSAGRKKTLVDELFQIPLKNREVVILFDSDAAYGPLNKALMAFSSELAKLGANPTPIALPDDFEMEKGGVMKGTVVKLDDFLEEHGEEALLRVVERAKDSPGKRSSYKSTLEGFIWCKPSREMVKLTNWTAKILSDIALDDDSGELRRMVEIEAAIGGKKKTFTIPIIKFGNLDFVFEFLGPKAEIHPGSSIKDHILLAIQQNSSGVEEKTSFAHLGWRLIDGNPVFITNGACIGACGLVLNLRTSLPDTLSFFKLPSPPEKTSLQTAIRLSLKMLDVAIDSVTFPVYCAVWTALLGQCKDSVHVYGGTGHAKTQLAALGQQHFGSEMDADHLPTGWLSTANSNEFIGFICKDSLMAIDDLVANNSHDDDRLQRQTEQFFRGQSNNQGRARLRPDGTLRPTRRNRSLPVSTGESAVRGESLGGARVLQVPVISELEWSTLSECQIDAAEGRYAEATAGYVQWLAKRYLEIQGNYQEDLQFFREIVSTSLSQNKIHKKIIDTAARLLRGLDYFFKFAVEIEAITQDEKDLFWNRATEAFKKLLYGQRQIQEDEDPTVKALDLLRALFVSGRAHLTSPEAKAPENPQAWGWAMRTTAMSDEWFSRGEKIGWVEDGSIYLQPRATWAALQKVAKESREFLAISLQGFKAQLKERGLLVACEKDRFETRKFFDGKREWVLRLRALDLEAPADVNGGEN